MRIGLFFGSFNPIHVGHLIVANTLATSTDLEQVWFVVSPQNPFKKTKSLLHEFDRLDMVERAIADNSYLKATDIEFSMPKPSYTIDTLDALTKKFPQHTFRLLMGEDNLDQFANWKQYERILTEFGLYVYPRPVRLTEVAKPNGMQPGGIPLIPFRDHPNVRLITAPLLDISATYIREAIRANRSIRYMVPDVVEEMIERKKFYV
jgi:nicotinate-nucleotide adenylyltransferase